MEANTLKIYRGIIINPLSDSKVEVINDGAICVYGSKILKKGLFSDISGKYPYAPINGNQLDIILPGLIDLHTHLPQFGALAFGKGELLDWLENYIFPEENKFTIKSYAKEISKLFFKEAISYGTTCPVIFSSVHKEATDIAFKSASDCGIKAYIGKCMMDSNSPDYMISSLEENIADSLELIDKWHNHDTGRLNYILSPRYAGSCSMELMKKVSSISNKMNIHIQSHIAENQNELKYISSLFPKADSYTEVYSNAGMLSDKVLLAHGIYLSSGEIDLLHQLRVNLIHCPTANRFLNSGIMPFRNLKDRGIKIGLGSDIAAGTTLSLFNEMREAIESSKSINGYEGYSSNILTGIEVFYSATLGAAEILDIESSTGNLDEGKDADFIILQNSMIPKNATNEELLKYLIYYYSNKKVNKTYVRGNEIYPIS